MHRQHHDRRAWALFLDLLCRLEPVHVRHPDIHEDHVGELTARVLDGLAPGPGFAHDLEIVGLGEHRGDSLADELVIVDEQHTNGHRAGILGTGPPFDLG